MTHRFTITYDYLCPFARNANEAVAEALDAGADYEVLFAPFSLHQNSRGEDAPAIWDDPSGADGSGVRALLWSLAVRHDRPDRFLPFHLALFAARHDDAADINDAEVLHRIATASGIDADSIDEVVTNGEPMANLRSEHSWLVDEFGVFGVPTFIAGDEAVFVRMMERHRVEDLAKIVEMLEWSNLNEFKRTRVRR